MAEEGKKKKGISLLGVVLIVLFALVLGAGGMYAYLEYRPMGSGNEFQQIQRYLSTVMLLPTEVPTFATVSDITKLQDQKFFTNAQNGDKVLIYPVARIAILFRPLTRKIISVGPINIKSSVSEVPGTATASISGTVTPTRTVNVVISGTTIKPESIVTIAIYNSTGTTGLAKTVEQKLKTTYPAGSVVLRKDAKGEYKKTIVVDLSGKQKTQAAALAKAVGGTVSLLPEGEIKPSADLLIILGTDYK
jgi:hypothetical protein